MFLFISETNILNLILYAIFYYQFFGLNYQQQMDLIAEILNILKKRKIKKEDFVIEIGKLTGKSRNTIYNYLGKNTEPSLKFYEACAEILGVELNYNFSKKGIDVINKNIKGSKIETSIHSKNKESVIEDIEILHERIKELKEHNQTLQESLLLYKQIKEQDNNTIRKLNEEIDELKNKLK